MKFHKINIGAEIEARINQLSISKSEFGRKIGIPQQNVNRILEKTNIDTDKLLQICEALDYNFFNLYADQPNSVEFKGERNVQAQKIDKIDMDNRNFGESHKDLIEIDRFSEKIILPKDCREKERHLIEKLTLRIESLERLLEEKERFITHLLNTK